MEKKLIWIDEKTHKKLKIYAADNHMSMKDAFAQMVNKVVMDSENKEENNLPI